MTDFQYDLNPTWKNTSNKAREQIQTRKQKAGPQVLHITHELYSFWPKFKFPKIPYSNNL